MVQTPWGDAGDLRSRKLSPGRARSREEVARNQRQRLFAAMVASCAERGYEATSVADLIDLSGVSRASFYEHFKSKKDCFGAAIEEILQAGIEVIAKQGADQPPGERRARAVLDVFAELVASQPAAARMCLVESYAAGETGTEPVTRAVANVERLGRETLEQMPGRADTGPELARAVVGGIHRVLYRRLHACREAELPGLCSELWDWAMSFRPPPEPLRLRSRRPALPSPEPMPRFAAYDVEQRIVRALAAVVAERGYAAATIADISGAASISQSTFYEYFTDKRDALELALDSSGAQLLAATLPSARRAPDWPAAVRVALAATCSFLAAEPDFARLRSVAVYEAGPEAIERRDAAGSEVLQALLALRPGDLVPATPLTIEATVGAVYSILYEQVLRDGPESLPEIAPLITYVTLAPLLGPAAACEVANGDGKKKRQGIA